MIVFGAQHTNTLKYTLPRYAKTYESYCCILCKERLLLHKGSLSYFEHPKESTCLAHQLNTQLMHESVDHCNAKILLYWILEKRLPLVIRQRCEMCFATNNVNVPLATDSQEIHMEYPFMFYGCSRIADVACVENGVIQYIIEIYHGHQTQEGDRPEPWFECRAQDILQISHFEREIILNNNRVYYCETCQNQNILNCIAAELLQEDIENTHEGNLYFNQRGAGCGKTYESIQLLQEDSRFLTKDTFVYLSKMHSAKEVIYQELQEQQQRGVLSDLTVINICNGKQHEITYFHLSRNKNITIIIGTIDSFTFAVVDKDQIVKEADYFKSIVKTLRHGHFTLHPIRYAGQRRNIDQRCLILIDEAQDLGADYISAFVELVKQRNTDVYIIGDKLQSIWSENNIYTYVENNVLDIPLVSSVGENKVMRFHNTKFIEFVNNMIPFQKYNLPQITNICDGRNCKYQHENEKEAVILFDCLATFKADEDNANFKKMDDAFDTIRSIMDLEIQQYHYLPENFMFIFPILSSSEFAITLEIRLQRFWMEKMEDPWYQSILQTHEYWNDHIQDPRFPNQYYKYVHLHKSDEGKSINLRESIHATRILSIHASKGTGCEVVFVIGLTEKTLTVFSKEKNNLVFDSLLHVALTRQKKKLYIGIQDKQNDEIVRRLQTCLPLPNNGMCKILTKIISTKHLKTFILNSPILFEEFDQQYSELFHELLLHNKPTNEIIDFGFHALRYSAMVTCLMLCAMAHDERDTQQQIRTVLCHLAKTPVKMCNQIEYVTELRKLSKRYDLTTKNEPTTFVIPVLQFTESQSSEYYKYADLLRQFIERIQCKLIGFFKGNYCEVPEMCALECLIFDFMRKTFQLGSKNDASILEIYSIMYCYDYCSDLITAEHTHKYRCCCSSFTEGSILNNTIHATLRKIIVQHFENLGNIQHMFAKYKEYLVTELQVQQVSYNCSLSLVVGNHENVEYLDYITLVGYSHTHNYVFNFIIRPQLNTLNLNEIMVHTVVDNFLLQMTSHEKFHGKEIYNCLFTFETNDPFIFKLPVSNHQMIKTTIEKHLCDEFTTQHKIIFQFYQQLYNSSPNQNDALQQMYDKIKLFRDNDLRSSKKEGIHFRCKHDKEEPQLHNIPSYLITFFEQKCIDSDENPSSLFIDENYFLRQLNKYFLFKIRNDFFPK